MSEAGRELNNFQEAMPTVRAGRALRRKLFGSSGRFDCGLRVVSGVVRGERARWSHKASHIDGNVLFHGDTALALELLDQVPNPGGIRLSARCLVWQARVIASDAIVQLAFVARDAQQVLTSGLANGRELRPNPDIDAL